MITTYLSFAELLVHVHLVNDPIVVVIYLPSWKRRDPKTIALVNSIISVLSTVVDRTILINFNGAHSMKLVSEHDNEVMAEDHILNELKLSDLPELVIYSRYPLGNTHSKTISDITDMYSIYTARLVNILQDTVSFLSFLTAAQQYAKLLAGNVFDSISDPLTNQSRIIHTLFNNQKLGTVNLGLLFVSGDKSSVGKSSTCLGLLASLVNLGVPPSSLAYIKPVTQCEAEQSITKYCEKVGIAHQGIGPVVFYKGFTRAYLQGSTESAEEMLRQVLDAVRTIGNGKQFIVVDGVGYPSVGSICNVSNADVARELKAPVLLVGKAGVGDAVDSHNLNSVFFENSHVRVLGAVFNKLPMSGFYSLESCREAVSMYFSQYRKTQSLYGFIPVIENMDDYEKNFTQIFINHFDIGKLLLDLWNYKVII